MNEIEKIREHLKCFEPVIKGYPENEVEAATRDAIQILSEDCYALLTSIEKLEAEKAELDNTILEMNRLGKIAKNEIQQQTAKRCAEIVRDQEGLWDAAMYPERVIADLVLSEFKEAKE